MRKWIYLEPPRRIHWVHQVALFYITENVFVVDILNVWPTSVCNILHSPNVHLLCQTSAYIMSIFYVLNSPDMIICYDRLAEKIIGKKQTSIEIKKHSVMLVRKCVQKETWKFQRLFSNLVQRSSNTKQQLFVANTKNKVEICKKWILLHGCNTLQRITN